MSPEDMHIGERIELRRKQRGMSRRALAQLVGRSEEWLRQVEIGQRPLPGVELVARLTEVLHFRRIDELLEWSPPRRMVPREPGPPVQWLRQAVLDHPAVGAYPPDQLPAAAGSPPYESGQLASEAEQCWQIWSESPDRYSVLTLRLPRLIAHVQSVRWSTPTAATGRLLVETYHLARLLLTRLGDYQLAWLVSDRAMGIAAVLREPSLVAASAWHVGAAFMTLSLLDESWEYATAAARRLDKEPGSNANTCLSGALHMLTALGAAAAQNTAKAEEAMQIAVMSAQEVGHDELSERIWFGPTEIAIGQVQLALRMGDLPAAVAFAGTVELPAEYPTARRVRHYLTAAYAFAHHGDDSAAVLAMLRAEQACPEDIRYDWLARRTLQHLIRRGNPLVSTEVRRLAARAGMT